MSRVLDNINSFFGVYPEKDIDNNIKWVIKNGCNLALTQEYDGYLLSQGIMDYINKELDGFREKGWIKEDVSWSCSSSHGVRQGNEKYFPMTITLCIGDEEEHPFYSCVIRFTDPIEISDVEVE